MTDAPLRYAKLSDEELATELQRRLQEARSLLTEIRDVLREAADVG